MLRDLLPDSAILIPGVYMMLSHVLDCPEQRELEESQRKQLEPP